MKANNTFSKAQILYLDLLRAGAALGVLLGHSSHFFLQNSFLSKTGIENLGVIIFFLISGFLISFSVFRRYNEPSYTFKEYFIDRFCRIFVPFIPALCFVFIIDLFTLSLPLRDSARSEALTWIPDVQKNSSLLFFFGNLLMLQDFPLFQVMRLFGVPDNAFFIRPFGSAGPFWTISIEWWIYMMFGLLALRFIKNKAPLNFGFIVLIIFVSIVPVYYLIGGVGNCLSFLWIFGMVFSFMTFQLYTKSDYLLARIQKPLILSLIVFFAFFCLIGRLFSIYADTRSFRFGELQFCVFLSIMIFATFFLLQSFKKVPIVVQKMTAFLAEYSYSLYLTHFSVLIFLYFKYPENKNNLFYYILSFLICNLVAVFFYFAFEKHHRRVAALLKKYFVYT